MYDYTEIIRQREREREREREGGGGGGGEGGRERKKSTLKHYLQETVITRPTIHVMIIK